MSAQNLKKNGMTIRARDNFIYGGISFSCVVWLVWIIPTFTPPYPGYGVSAALLPNIVVTIILALSVGSLVINYFIHQREKSDKSAIPEETPTEDKVHLLHLVRFMIPCLLLMPAMAWIGFVPGGILFMLIIQYSCGQRKPVTAVLGASITVGVLYVIMRYGLGVPMP